MRSKEMNDTRPLWRIFLSTEADKTCHIRNNYKNCWYKHRLCATAMDQTDILVSMGFIAYSTCWDPGSKIYGQSDHWGLRVRVFPTPVGAIVMQSSFLCIWAIANYSILLKATRCHPKWGWTMVGVMLRTKIFKWSSILCYLFQLHLFLAHAGTGKILRAFGSGRTSCSHFGCFCDVAKRDGG